MEDEKVFIELSKKQLAHKLSWLEERPLKQRDFEYLSSEIFKETKIELSTTTLRRIWSNNYKSLPQVHTLNAIALYLGYTDWNDLKARECNPSGLKKTKESQKQRVPLVAIITVILVILVTIVLWPSRTSPKPEVSLSISQKVSAELPATIGFNYDISQAKDPVSIELSWNPFERTLLNPADSFYTGVYYYPDYHRTKLLRDEEVLAEIPVYVTTPNWHALVMTKENDPHPVYLETRDFLREGQMGFDMVTLSPYLLRKPELILSVFTFSNTTLEQFEADNIKLNTRVKHHAHKSDPACSYIIVLLKAEHGRVSIPIMQKGCYGGHGVGFSEKNISGKTNNLTKLTFNLDDYMEVQMEVKNGVVTLQIGSNEYYSFTYQKELGMLKVAKVMISGFGSVDSFSIIDEANSYTEDFSAF